MRTISIFAFCALLFIQASTYDLYYNSFLETVGIEAHTTPEGKDCIQPVATAVYDFRDVLVNHYKDNDALCLGVADIVEKLKFETSPECRTFYGAFGGFMTQYFGDIEDLKDLAEQNLDVFDSEIERAIVQSTANLDAGEDSQAGKIHATVLRYFLGLEKKVQISETVELTQEVPVSTTEDSSQVESVPEANPNDYEMYDDYAYVPETVNLTETETSVETPVEIVTVVPETKTREDGIVEVVGIYIEEPVAIIHAPADEVLIVDASSEQESSHPYMNQGDEYVDEIVNDVLSAVEIEENLSGAIVLTIDATTEQVAIHTFDVDVSQYADEIIGDVVGVIGGDEDLNGAVIITVDTTNDQDTYDDEVYDDVDVNAPLTGYGDEIVGDMVPETRDDADSGVIDERNVDVTVEIEGNNEPYSDDDDYMYDDYTGAAERRILSEMYNSLDL